MTSVAASSFRKDLRTLLALALPIIGSNLAQASTHLADTVMLGWYDVDALAAGVLGGTMFIVLMIVGSGFAMAATPLAAAAEGSGLTWRVRRVVRMSWWITLLFAAAMIYPLRNAEPILLALGQEQHTAALAGEYLRITLWGLPAALTVVVMRSFFLALVRPQIVFAATAAGAAVNALGNYALIFGNWGAPELGLNGAAAASVISHFVALGVMMAYFASVPDFRSYALLKRIWRPNWPEFIEVFRLGWPISATLLAEVGMFSLCAIMMGWIDTTTLAAHGIVLEMASIVFMVHLGLSNASTVLVGRAVGRNDIDELNSSARAVMVLSGGLVCVTVAVFLAVPETLVRAFLDTGDAEAGAVLAIGTVLMRFAAAFQLADALQVIALGLLRGMSDTRAPMVIATISYMAIGIPCSYLLGFGLGFDGPGVWAGLTIGLGLAAVLLLRRFRAKVGALRT